MRIFLAISFTLSLILAGCGAGDPELSAIDTSTPFSENNDLQPEQPAEISTLISSDMTPTMADQESSPNPPSPTSSASGPLVDTAKADLSERLGIDSDEIEIVSVEEVTWPNAGLGCPEPDMRYIQVPVDGLLIRLRAGDRVYDYHSGGTRPPFLCEPKPSAKSTSPALDQYLPTPPSTDE